MFVLFFFDEVVPFVRIIFEIEQTIRFARLVEHQFPIPVEVHHFFGEFRKREVPQLRCRIPNTRRERAREVGVIYFGRCKIGQLS